jgi:hypothetical protein
MADTDVEVAAKTATLRNGQVCRKRSVCLSNLAGLLI